MARFGPVNIRFEYFNPHSGSLTKAIDSKNVVAEVRDGVVFVYQGGGADPTWKFPLQGGLQVYSGYLPCGKFSIRSLACSMLMLVSTASTDMATRFLECCMGKKRGPPVATSGHKRPRQGETDTSHIDAHLVVPRRLKVVTAAPTEPMTQEQETAISLAAKGYNVFITGGAGTGKSYLLQQVIKQLDSRVTMITASTAVAACIVGGITLHTFAGCSTTASVAAAVASVKKHSECERRWRAVRTLVIDEISMIDGGYFDLLNAVGQAIRGNTAPFGGIQLVVCGDFFQLPPVARDGQPLVFAFQSHSWQKAKFQVVELRKIFRQADPTFATALSFIRKGQCPPDVVQLLQQRVGIGAHASNDIIPTKLLTHKSDVDQMNEEELLKLDTTRHQFDAVDKCLIQGTDLRIIEQQCRARAKLVLKVGCQVMLVKTLSVADGLVNGARGVVVGFAKSGNAPVVRFATGNMHTIRPELWTIMQGGTSVATRTQVPLELAWAVSIHKSQGMSLDAVEINLQRTFEAGQAYVALSRARSLAGLVIMGDFDASMVRANPQVVDFYSRIAGDA